ncbi:MAG TPA: hypothetical protein VHL78_11095 [Actinomycetota bacterium]|nr:hypothetical protein [Actinomycetota bacterium]
MLLGTGAMSNVGSQTAILLRVAKTPSRVFVRDEAKVRKILGDEVDLRGAAQARMIGHLR